MNVLYDAVLLFIIISPGTGFQSSMSILAWEIWTAEFRTWIKLKFTGVVHSSFEIVKSGDYFFPCKIKD